jgi:hypothetical protein
MNQILRFPAMEAETDDFVNFIFNVAVRELHGQRGPGGALKARIRMVWTEKFGVEGIVNIAGYHRCGKI